MSARAKRQAHQGEAPSNSRSDQSHLAGIGLTGVALASAGVSFVLLVGAVSFDVWPHASPEHVGVAAELGGGVESQDLTDGEADGELLAAILPGDVPVEQAPGTKVPDSAPGPDGDQPGDTKPPDGGVAAPTPVDENPRDRVPRRRIRDRGEGTPAGGDEIGDPDPGGPSDSDHDGDRPRRPPGAAGPGRSGAGSG